MTVIMKDKGCTMSSIGFYLIVVGAVNWGLVGIGNFFGGDWNIIHTLFGFLGDWGMWLENATYVVVGICGVMLAVGCKCAKCSAAGVGDQPM